jgi:hypothetical protein
VSCGEGCEWGRSNRVEYTPSIYVVDQ